MLDLNNVELNQELFYQKIAQEERLEGWQKGRQQGRYEGRQEGRQEGEIQLLTRQLDKRFAPLPEWVGLKLLQAESSQLEYWAERILDAKSVDDVFE